jgi:two-component system, chemotaxis family, protein-glutamate methylesterase/glutaminase
MKSIRVLIVDDSAAVRRLLRLVLSEDPELEISGVAANGKIALALLEQNAPDVMTLDIEMPEMDGLKTLEHIRKRYPRLPVIMFSTLTERGAVATLDALSLGASDYVTKPATVTDVAQAIASIRQQLVPRIKSLCRRVEIPALRTDANPAPAKNSGAPVELVAIGTSTGGPNALAEVLAAFPADLPVPVVIVQHMPATFTRFLAERLSRICPLPVREAVAGVKLAPGEVWIAPGDYHMVVSGSRSNCYLQLLQTPPENSCRPSVDVLFRSVAPIFRQGLLAVVMTGMGQDGLRGAETVCAQGGRVWAQDAATSVVWGMPGFVVQHGLAQRVLPVGLIGQQITGAVVQTRNHVVPTMAGSL